MNFSNLKRVLLFVSIVLLYTSNSCNEKKAEAAAEEVANETEEAVDAAEKAASEAVETARDAANDAVKAAEEAVKAARDAAQEASAETTDAAKAALEAAERAAREAEKVRREAERKAQEANATRKRGGIGYAVPEQMKVGKEYDVRAIISHQKHFKKQETKSYLESFAKESKEKLKEEDPNYIIQIDSLVIYDIMKMELIDPREDRFTIKEHISEEEQVIDNISKTVWRWKIIPLKKGEHDLIIKATAKIKTTTGTSQKDIVVYSKVINVKANIPYVVKDKIQNNWRWAWSALVIPLFLLFRKRISRWWKKRSSAQRQAGFRH